MLNQRRRVPLSGSSTSLNDSIQCQMIEQRIQMGQVWLVP